MDERRNYEAKDHKYPLAVRKWESKNYYVYFDNVNPPIDARVTTWGIFKYDVFKGHVVGEPLIIKKWMN